MDWSKEWTWADDVRELKLDLCDRLNYLGSEISRPKMCHQWSEIWGRRDYLGSDVSSMSLPKPFS